ncbi:unnamed protein product [Darwinula stevensoni]|nr:unnamed protein product [Darwinula stevensoni]CAG0879173.1 unnamed protein product [Darwinula stevensoni]
MEVGKDKVRSMVEPVQNPHLRNSNQNPMDFVNTEGTMMNVTLDTSEGDGIQFPTSLQDFPGSPVSLPGYATSPSIMGTVPSSSSVPSSLNNSSRSTPGGHSTTVVRQPDSKIESLKKWSVSTYKCTRQIISEKLGKSSRTVDAELESQIELLRDTHRRHINILRLAKGLANNFYQVVQTQHSMGEAFADLAQKTPELQDEYLYNADTQRTLSKNGEILLAALGHFISSLNTLCNKTMEDTLLSIRKFEAARLEYDAYRTELEVWTGGPKSESSGARIHEAQSQVEIHKNNYEKLREEVSIKLKFLHDNKVKVMHKQLMLFHNAVSSYFSGNQANLEATIKQFNVRVTGTPPVTPAQTWLEQ